MKKADLARQIVEKFPHTSKKELGKILYKLNPLVFKDEEAARTMIRAVTGSHGDPKDRISPTHKEIYKGLPKGKHNDYSHFILSSGKWGVMSDIHIPAHDDQAVGATLEYFKKHGIKKIILNGDIVDCYQVSDHLRDPTEPQLRAEFEALKMWLKFLVKNGFTEIVYKLGNHEERLERYLIQKAISLFNWEVLSWEALISMDFISENKDGKYVVIDVVNNGLLKNVTIVQNKRIIKAGSLAIVHGHEFGRQQVFNPVNPARGYFMRAKSSVLGGDKHQTSEHIESDINGKIIGAWSTGCLCDLHPKYLPINRWNLGAAIVEHDGDEFEVHNFKIINGRIR